MRTIPSKTPLFTLINIQMRHIMLEYMGMAFYEIVDDA